MNELLLSIWPGADLLGRAFDAGELSENKPKIRCQRGQHTWQH